jgi:Skp family chaperone for outer membrane proteins
MKRRTHLAAVTLLLITLMVPAVRSQATTGAVRDVNVAFQEATQASSEFRQSADRLHAIARNGEALSRESHARHLNLVTDDVNRLGKLLTRLESLTPHASDAQRAAIENMRPRLMRAADALSNAIGLLQSRSYNVRFSPYQDSLRMVSQDAESLHQEFNAVQEYETAKSRLAGLDVDPASGTLGR